MCSRVGTITSENLRSFDRPISGAKRSSVRPRRTGRSRPQSRRPVISRSSRRGSGKKVKKLERVAA